MPSRRLTNTPSGFGFVPGAAAVVRARRRRPGRGRPSHCPAIGEPREQQAPVVALGDPQLGNHRVQAELVDRRPVDPADQGPGQPVDQRVPETAPQERTHGDVIVIEHASAGDILRHPRLLGPREQPRPGEWERPRRQHQAEPLGHRDQLAAVADVDRARVPRAHQLIGQAQLAGQGDGRRTRGQERVRAPLDHESIDPLGRDLPPQPVARLDERDGHAATSQVPRSGEPGDPATDDEDAHRGSSGSSAAIRPEPPSQRRARSRTGRRCSKARTGTAGPPPADRPSTPTPAPGSRHRRVRTRTPRSAP